MYAYFTCHPDIGYHVTMLTCWVIYIVDIPLILHCFTPPLSFVTHIAEAFSIQNTLDAAHANKLCRCCATTGYALLLNFGFISYCSKTQSIAVTSSMEASKQESKKAEFLYRCYSRKAHKIHLSVLLESNPHKLALLWKQHVCYQYDQQLCPHWLVSQYQHTAYCHLRLSTCKGYCHAAH